MRSREGCGLRRVPIAKFVMGFMSDRIAGTEAGEAFGEAEPTDPSDLKCFTKFRAVACRPGRAAGPKRSEVRLRS